MLRKTCFIAFTLIFVVSCSSPRETTRGDHEMGPDEMGQAEDNFYKHLEPKSTRSTAQQPVKTKLEPSTAPLVENRGGELAREALVSFLDLGPPALLRNVQVYPVLDGERFVGFEIQSFFPKHRQLQNIDLHKGDVVVAVNSVSIIRPDDLFKVWESLRTAPRLQVDFIRGHTLQTYTWEIVD